MGNSTPESDVIAQVEDLCKVYGMDGQQVPALSGITVSFRRGSFWAIMGPSGSGKSTLLNLLGCLDTPTSGRYLLEGRNVSSLEDNTLSDIRLTRFGFIFQSFNLIPQLTVQENIELPLFYLGWGPHQSSERARELAASVGLEERLRHRPAQLSGGQQQRVAAARALANDPAIVLADEPTGNLDTATGKEIMELIAGLNAQGKTIIMVTHEAHVAAYARQRLHLRDGRIESLEGAGS